MSWFGAMLCFCLKGKLHSQTILTSSQQVDWILLCQVKWPLSCCHYLLRIQLVLRHAFPPTEAQKVLSPVIDWQTLQDYRCDAESRATSLQWEEAAQSQTGRYFKPTLLVLVLFLDQKPQLHMDTVSSLGAGLQTLLAKCFVHFPCAKGHYA